MKKSKWGLVVLGIIVLGSLRVWRCGVRERLTLYEFIQEHTIYGHEVEYVPMEYLTGGWKREQLTE